jgi:hypothetical protein
VGCVVNKVSFSMAQKEHGQESQFQHVHLHRVHLYKVHLQCTFTKSGVLRRLLDLLLVGFCNHQVNEFTIAILKFTMATQEMHIPGVTDKLEYMLAAMRKKNLSAMDPLAKMEKLEKVNAKVSKMRAFLKNLLDAINVHFFATCYNSGSRPEDGTNGPIPGSEVFGRDNGEDPVWRV